MRNCIAVPVYNGVGVLLGYMGRDTTKDGKQYRHAEKFHPEWELYNLERCSSSEQFQERGVVVVFDIFDVFHCYEAGIENVISLMGTSMSDIQEAKLTEYEIPDKRITMLAGDADVEEAQVICARLSTFAHVRLVITKDYATIPDAPVEALEEMLS